MINNLTLLLLLTVGIWPFSSPRRPLDQRHTRQYYQRHYQHLRQHRTTRLAKHHSKPKP